MRKIGVTGGIGGGKSIVCTLFNRLGVPVYDSDAKAKELANNSPQIVCGIKELLGEQAYIGGELQRKFVASKVFSDKSLLVRLNGVIHPVVAEDFKLWCAERECGGAKYVILESAILIESGFDSQVDEIVCVTAPLDVRVERVVVRDGSMREDVESRINNQISDVERVAKSQYTIVNDGKSLIMPQVVKLNAIFNDERV